MVIKLGFSGGGVWRASKPATEVSKPEARHKGDYYDRPFCL